MRSVIPVVDIFLEDRKIHKIEKKKELHEYRSGKDSEKYSWMLSFYGNKKLLLRM